MNKNKINLVLILTLIIFLISSFYYFFQNRQKNTLVSDINTNTDTNIDNTNKFNFYCEEGDFTARFSSSSVKVLFKNDNKEINFSQAVSGSGARYESGSLEFWNKGDNAFINDGDKNIYTNCVTGILTQNDNKNNWTDNAKIFSFDYKNDLEAKVYGDDGSYTTEWSNNSYNDVLGMLFVNIKIQKTFLPFTNFSDAKFKVSASSEEKAISSCSENTRGRKGDVIKENINGIVWTKIKSSDPGAGNIYDTTSYKTIKNNMCYAVEYTIHSTNIMNYDASQNIKEFDKSKIENILEDMVKSFRFLN